MVDVVCAELQLEGTRVHADVAIRAGGTTVNAAIAAAAAGADATGDGRAATGAEPAEAARARASRFEPAVVKLAEGGAIIVRGDRMERAAAEPVERRSAFGAGDAFAGALLVALAEDDSLERALELAC